MTAVTIVNNGLLILIRVPLPVDSKWHKTSKLQNSGSELLDAFRYADFSFDESKDVPTLLPTQIEAADENLVTKCWDQIIPEADRKRFAQEEREKAERELFLGPRQRTKVKACKYL